MLDASAVVHRGQLGDRIDEGEGVLGSKAEPQIESGVSEVTYVVRVGRRRSLKKVREHRAYLTVGIAPQGLRGRCQRQL